MKKTLMFLFIIVQTSVFSQKIKLGPELGINLIPKEPIHSQTDYKIGLNVGGNFDYYFTKDFSIRSGLFYSQKKQSYSQYDTLPIALLQGIGFEDIPLIDLNTYSTINANTLQHYLQLPLLANYKFFNFNVFGGGYFGYSIGSKTFIKEIKSTPFSQTIDLSSILSGIEDAALLSAFLPAPYSESSSETNSKSNLTQLDWGVKFGIGYTFDLVEFNLGYVYGLTDSYSSDFSIKDNHDYFQINIKYLFDFVKG